MRANLTKEEWDAYRANELATLTPLLTKNGFVLDETQLHTSGERYLMSGKKLVLTGRREKDGLRVVIKGSTDAEGRKEIRHEKEARDTLTSLAFSHDVLLSPEEIWYEDSKTHTILVTAFIEQPHIFIDRSPEEQFFLALRALETQEGFHATTYAHEKEIAKVFPIWRAANYLQEFARFEATIAKACADQPEVLATIARAHRFLKEREVTIERHSPYLAHTDLVPHNLRVSAQGLFILDYDAFRFGNRYESWARLVNYMLIHNPQLGSQLIAYVRDNRSEDEYLALRLMRVYIIVFLLEYYAKALSRTIGTLQELTKARIVFWTRVLNAVLADTEFPKEEVEKYVALRNSLRSPEETARQREFAKT